MELFVSKLRGVRERWGIGGEEGRMFVLQSVNVAGGSIRSITCGKCNI